MRIHQMLLSTILMVSGATCPAQTWQLTNSLDVQSGANLLKNGWAGGLQAPQFIAIDLDNDGKKDLAAFDRQDNKIIPYLRIQAGADGLEWAPQFLSNFPAELNNWVIATDYDQDGLVDLFTGSGQGSNVIVYRNISNPGQAIQFSPTGTRLFSLYPPLLPLYVSASDYPAVQDVDHDGDQDLLTFNLGGVAVEWHKNLSMESFGHSDSLIFEVQSRCFGHFQESPAGCIATIGLTPCGPGERLHEMTDFVQKNTMHVGSTLLCLDIDQDSLMDLVVGDIGCREVYALFNGGTTAIASFDSVIQAFPAQSPIDINQFPAVFAIDLDDDGKLDLLSAPNVASSAEDQKSIQWHRNQDDNIANFQNLGYGWFQEDMLDFGTGANPTLMDVDVDGTMDLLVGNQGKIDSNGTLKPRLAWLRNVGSNMSPRFVVENQNFLELDSQAGTLGLPAVTPTAGDLDGDGDHDLVFGNQNGTLVFFKNNTVTGSPPLFQLQSTAFAGVDVGLFSAPQLYDWNQDGKLDLLIGNGQGRIAFYRNIGSNISASFVKVTDSLGKIKINDASGLSFTNGFAKPCMADLNADGFPELLVGTVTGEVHVFESHGLSPTDSFPRISDLAGLDFGGFSAPSGILDSISNGLSGFLFVGNMRGGVEALERTTPASSIPQQISLQSTLNVFPNPFRDRLTIEILRNAQKGEIKIHDSLGKTLWTGKLSQGQHAISTSDWPRGIYFISIQTQSAWSSKRAVKL